MAEHGGTGMKVLLIAPNVDGTDVGEALMAFKWAEALAARVDLTVLCFQRPGRAEVAGQLPGARVVTWPEPAWPVFAGHVRRWIATAEARGERFDIAHQLMPQAARYPSPLRHFATPYIIGPLGGALDTPEAFRAVAGSAPLFTRLRALDATRFRLDPWLRASYSRAACILGVAPYVQDVLGAVPLQRFESVLELGVDGVAPERPRQMEIGRLDVLHVGRAVRTKGLRDVIRALALLPDLPGIRLTSAGAGEELDLCRAEAEKLGVADRVRFLGRVPRSEVEALYESHDLFCFPSFREPAGGVLYEAMRHGLPVITADRGGPASIIDATSGIKLPVTNPTTFAADIAAALRRMALFPKHRAALGEGARAKVLREGLWSAKAERMVALYREITSNPTARATHPKG
jgi:glycosyltransferase involved in cell wall biosynthesis